MVHKSSPGEIFYNENPAPAARVDIRIKEI